MFKSLKRGMRRTRERFSERMNVLFDRGPDVDEDFWDGLEEALIESDVGAATADDIVERMRDEATRQAMSDGYEVMDRLVDEIADQFATAEVNVFDENPVCVVFVGVNGAGKTTTCGKIAAAEKAAGRSVLMGNGDTFRAAAREQLEVWARRAGVEVVERDRGADPASVCYDTLERAEKTGADMVLIDTAGRLHTSDDLMRELKKVVGVVRKRASVPVRVVLVLDATTGQNGITQAQEFDKALGLDAVIVTKLDGTARGGIALNVSHELGLPVAKVGVGESLEDLQDFDAHEYAAALIGAEPVDEDEEAEEGRPDEPHPAEQAERMAQQGAPALEHEAQHTAASDAVEAAAQEGPAVEHEADEGAEAPAAEASVEEASAAAGVVTDEEAGAEPVEAEPASEAGPTPAGAVPEDGQQEQPAQQGAETVDDEQQPEDDDEHEPEGEGEPAFSSEEEGASQDAGDEGKAHHKKEGRLKRMFKWHRRKDR